MDEGQRPRHGDFGKAAALSTSATFSVHGVYVLRLTANDGALSTSDTLTVTIDSNPPNKAIDFGGTNAYVTFGPGARARGVGLHPGDLVPA